MKKYHALLALVVTLFAATALAANSGTPDLTLKDTITGAAHHSYLLLPFEIPTGVKALEIRFDYTGREHKTTIDVGLLGPGDTFDASFRGWSGGNKRSFVLAAGDATPSYLSGPVTPGRWQLLLGVPNIRSDQTAQFTAEVYFLRDDSYGLPVSAVPLRSEAGWYRGDLHMHSGHSDGSCASKSGERRGPCPLFLTLDAAAERGLDFVAVTEHNTNSHVRELTALQSYFDRTLLIPGMELTTFQGHANAFNIREPVDFRVGSESVPDWNALLTSVAKQGAIVSINHPRVLTGEACMGCGWSPQGKVDYSRVQAVEVVNGRDVETPIAGLPFWHEQLQRGHRLTAIGGSDTHDATTGRIGVPTTVVYAKELSVAGIVAGIRSGNVFVDTVGTRDRMLEFTAHRDDETVVMGGELSLKKNAQVTFEVRITQVPQGKIEIVRDGEVMQQLPAITHEAEQLRLSFTQKSDGKRHWLRVNVRDNEGRLVLIGNPIYLTPYR